MLASFALSVADAAAPFEPLRPYLRHSVYRSTAINEFYRVAQGLGDDFLPQLLAFIAGDTALYYYIGARLADVDDARNTPAYRYLGLTILAEGLVLCAQSDDPLDQYRLVSINVVAAREAKRMGFDLLAKQYKQQFLALTENNRDLLMGGWPAGTPADNAAFDAI